MEVKDIVSIFFQRVTHNLGEKSHYVLGALTIFLVGFFLAWVFGLAVKMGLKKLKLSQYLKPLAGEKEFSLPLEDIAGRTVFYLLLTFVMVATFQTLGLTIITEPLNHLLNQIFVYFPRAIGAVGILSGAWLLAHILRLFTLKTLRYFDLEQKVRINIKTEAGDTVSETDSVGLDQQPLENTLSELVYWLTLLLFSPAFLQAVGMEGLLTPVQNMLDQILSYIPRLMAAVAILLVGWFLAKIIQRLATHFVLAIPIGSVLKTMGNESTTFRPALASNIGLIAYVLVLLPSVISALQALELEAITKPASHLLVSIFEAVPLFFAASLILGIAYLIGILIGQLTTQFLTQMGFNEWCSRQGFRSSSLPLSTQSLSASRWVGVLVQVFVLLFASVEAFHLLHLLTLAHWITELTSFLIKVITGMGLLGLGMWLAHLSTLYLQQHTHIQARLFAHLTRYAILIISGAMALRQMGLAEDIVLLTFGALTGCLAIAFAIAFGLGGKTYVANHLEEWVPHLFQGSPLKNEDGFSNSRHLQVTKTLLEMQESERTQAAFTLGTEIEQELLIVMNHLQQDAADSPLIEKVQNIMHKLQETADKLRPAALDELGLAAAIETELNQWRSEGAMVQWHPPQEEASFTYLESTHIYRLFHSLKNYLQHVSHANKVYVRLEKHLGGIDLEIRENGEFCTFNNLKILESRQALELTERLQALSAQIEIKDQGNTNVWRIQLAC